RSATFLLPFSSSAPPRVLPSFPTRRSSDLPPHRGRRRFRFGCLDRDRASTVLDEYGAQRIVADARSLGRARVGMAIRILPRARVDRKSTRLNSSHQIISYAVFCLKKKTQRL